MKTALMVAEKPSLAASLASILSNGRHSTRKGMSTQLCSVYFSIELPHATADLSMPANNFLSFFFTIFFLW